VSWGRCALALGLALLVCARAAGAAESDPLARVEQSLRSAGDRLTLVEREYGQSEDPAEILRLRKNFSDGETQYLLGEYANAAALLYDVVDALIYRNEETYPDALAYLADSLYRQQSWLEARRYYRELLEQRMAKYQQESLLKLIELSDKTSDWSGIDEGYRALVAAGGSLRPEVVYFHAKWLARRPDLADRERIERALEAFRGIGDATEYGPQARYFEGALLVQRGALDEAVAAFEKVLALPALKEAAGAKARIRDLSLLALGRIHFEQGRYGPAVDRYQEVPKDSEAYNDALYELAATWLRLGEYEKALRTTELLLILVEESTIAPEAKLLEANLYLKLKRYAQAQQQFEAISDQYRPVREKIAALVKRENPVSYYDELLQQGEKSLDATQLLPDVARKYVTGRDVGQARVIIGELAQGRQGLDESDAILAKLDAAVENGKLDLFPTLQEGNARAVEVQNTLVRLDAELAALQGRLAEGGAPQQKAALAQARSRRLAVEARAQGALPQTAAQLDTRRHAYLERIAVFERSSLRLGLEIENIKAQLEAAQKWRGRTETQRAAEPDAEREFALQIERDRAIVGGLEQERQSVLRRLEVARAEAPVVAAGGKADDELRGELLAAVQQEATAAQATAALLGPAARAVFERSARAAAQVRELRERADRVRGVIHERAAAKLLSLRSRVEREKLVVAEYKQSVTGIEGGTKQLLGRIAFLSFARVERQFYDLVLKADVGIVDAAWTQKREKTEIITSVENDKRVQLKALQDEFTEVLKEVE
jgi:tetratricopeptide (TPR) repeat protein